MTPHILMRRNMPDRAHATGDCINFAQSPIAAKDCLLFLIFISDLPLSCNFLCGQTYVTCLIIIVIRIIAGLHRRIIVKFLTVFATMVIIIRL